MQGVNLNLDEIKQAKLQLHKIDIAREMQKHLYNKIQVNRFENLPNNKWKSIK